MIRDPPRSPLFPYSTLIRSSWEEGLRKKNAVSGSNNGLRVVGVGDTQTRSKPLAPGLFRVFRSVTSRLPRRAATCKSQAAWYSDRKSTRLNSCHGYI